MKLATYVFVVVVLSAAGLSLIATIWALVAGIPVTTAPFIALIYSLWLWWWVLPFFLFFASVFGGIFVILKRPTRWGGAVSAVCALTLTYLCLASINFGVAAAAAGLSVGEAVAREPLMTAYAVAAVAHILLTACGAAFCVGVIEPPPEQKQKQEQLQEA